MTREWRDDLDKPRPVADWLALPLPPATGPTLKILITQPTWGRRDRPHGANKNQDLLDAALLCVNRGEACIDHCAKQLGAGDTSMKDCMDTCAKQLGAGDTSMKDCMDSVSTMLPMCTAVVRFAAFDAQRLKEVVKLTTARRSAANTSSIMRNVRTVLMLVLLSSVKARR
jgi:hypothetical protein